MQRQDIFNDDRVTLYTNKTGQDKWDMEYVGSGGFKRRSIVKPIQKLYSANYIPYCEAGA